MRIILDFEPKMWEYAFHYILTTRRKKRYNIKYNRSIYRSVAMKIILDFEH